MLACAASALSQPTREPGAFLNQQRAVQQRVWDQLDQEAPAARHVAFDYGGWYGFHMFLYDDGVESSRTLRRNDLRVWGRLTLDGGAHEIYARGILSYLDFNTGDSFDGNDDDWEGPNLDRGYYEFNLARAMEAYAKRTLDSNLRVKIGRDLAKFGTGYALWSRLDHVLLRADYRKFELTGLIGRTVGSDPDFDLSRPIDRTRRAFLGVQARYLGAKGHEPFVYALWQRDHNEETSYYPGREYDYDSFYLGIGSSGELADNLWYSTEWVYESGHGHHERSLDPKTAIKAWAFDAELEYLFPKPMRPRASIEYMFASGDSDRTASPTDTYAGNQPNRVDRSFNGFGYRDTGLSFAPRLSNVHVWRVGGSLFPFEKHSVFKRLELGTSWFLYYKNRSAAAVSDPTADNPAGWLGWEMDYFANWEITTDLAWTTRFGVFFPGDAFDDQTTRTFLLVGATYSF